MVDTTPYQGKVTTEFLVKVRRQPCPLNSHISLENKGVLGLICDLISSKQTTLGSINRRIDRSG